MVKLVKKELVNEAKQVGKLYHVTTLDSLIQYIIPTDTLSGSGRYKNWMLGGITDVVSFTRDKRFVVKTNTNEMARVIYSFEVDGDKLSEKYRVLPYNDFAFNSDSGTLDLDTYNEEELEKEEVVVGKIHPFSKYVTGVRFSISIQGLGDIIDLVEDYNIKDSLPYLDKFEVKCDPRLVTSKNKRGWVFLSFPSYKAFVDSFVEIYEIITFNNVLDIDPNKIKEAFKFFTEEQLNFLLDTVAHGKRLSGTNRERGVYVLVCAGADYHSVGLKEFSRLDDAYIKVLWCFLTDREKEDYSMEGVDLDMIKDAISKENYYKLRDTVSDDGRELCYKLSSLGIIPARELRDFLIKMKDDYVKTKMKKL